MFIEIYIYIFKNCRIKKRFNITKNKKLNKIKWYTKLYYVVTISYIHGYYNAHTGLLLRTYMVTTSRIHGYYIVATWLLLHTYMVPTS